MMTIFASTHLHPRDYLDFDLTRSELDFICAGGNDKVPHLSRQSISAAPIAGYAVVFLALATLLGCIAAAVIGVNVFG